jgi:FkbM family methyltransferase
MPNKKNLLSRLRNFKIVLRYINESIGIIRQGYKWRDKLILAVYYLRIPAIILRSVVYKKTFAEIEAERKFLPGRIWLKNRNGIFYCGNNIITVYTLNQFKEEHIYPYFSIGDGAFIDVGAHIGKYAVKVGKNKPNKVIAIEPEEYNFTLLKKNVYKNGLSNTLLINKGVYSQKGKLSFYLSDKGEGLHSIFQTDDTTTKTTIDVDTLDNIIDEINFKGKIDLIKIDVEGAEVEVVKGALKIIKENHPKLIIEVSKENPQNLNDIKELLSNFNYKSEKLDEDNYFFSSISV